MSNTHRDDAMGATFKALAHPLRRQVLDILKDRPGLSLGELAKHFEVSRIAVMKHLATLEQAHLVISEAEGRKRLLYFNPVPIQIIYDRWTSEFSRYWSSQLTQLKYAVETKEQP